jgi:hypothetical protein
MAQKIPMKFATNKSSVREPLIFLLVPGILAVVGGMGPWNRLLS